MIGRLEGHEDRRAHIHLAGIQQGDRLPDHPLLLEALDAAPAGRFRQPHAVRDVGGGECAVFLEQVQNFAIELIHDTASHQLPIMRNSVAQIASHCHSFAIA